MTKRYLTDGILTDTLTQEQQLLVDQMTQVQYYLAMDAGGLHP